MRTQRCRAAHHTCRARRRAMFDGTTNAIDSLNGVITVRRLGHNQMNQAVRRARQPAMDAAKSEADQ